MSNAEYYNLFLCCFGSETHPYVQAITELSELLGERSRYVFFFSYTGQTAERSLPQTLRHSRTTVLQTFRHFAYYNPVCPKHSATRILQSSLLQTLRHPHTTIQFASNISPIAYYNTVCLKHSTTRILQYSLPQTLRHSDSSSWFKTAFKTCPFVS